MTITHPLQKYVFYFNSRKCLKLTVNVREIDKWSQTEDCYVNPYFFLLSVGFCFATSPSRALSGHSLALYGPPQCPIVWLRNRMLLLWVPVYRIFQCLHISICPSGSQPTWAAYIHASLSSCLHSLTMMSFSKKSTTLASPISSYTSGIVQLNGL